MQNAESRDSRRWRFTSGLASFEAKISAPQNVGSGVNTSQDEFVPFVTADGEYLWFSDYVEAPYQDGGKGKADIELATRHNGVYGAVTNPGEPVNSEWHELHPVLSPDGPHPGSTRYFLSDRPGSEGLADVWQATWVSEPSGVGLSLMGLSSAFPLGRRRLVRRRPGVEPVKGSFR